MPLSGAPFFQGELRIMRRDIDEALRDWPYEPEEAHGIAVREIRARDGRAVLQIRIELGLLQLEVEDRPDGSRPHGCSTYLSYLRQRANDYGRGSKSGSGATSGSGAGAGAGGSGRKRPPKWVMSQDHCEQADRELVQFYQRRVAWLALQRYPNALRDAEHTLALMDFVTQHSPSAEYLDSHERFRPQVLLHRAQALAAIALEKRMPEEAVDSIREGVGLIEKHQRLYAERRGEEDSDPEYELTCQGSIDQLQRLEVEIRKNFEIPKTLGEQLAEAVASEDYETAAWLRDRIRSQRAKQRGN